MNSKLIVSLLLLNALLISSSTFSQSILQPSLSDTLFSPTNSIYWNKLNHRRRKYYEILIPATLISYGAITFKSDLLMDINEDIKEELYTEHKHKIIHLDNYLQFAPSAAVYALNIAGINGKHNMKDKTIIYGLSTAIMSSVVFSVKKVSKELRPDGSNQYSFPSGHTATSFAAAEFMRQEYKDVSQWYGIAGYIAAGATGYLRMYNNKHWLSDVLAGAGIGILSTKLAYSIYPFIKNKIFNRVRGNTLVLPLYQNGSIGLDFVRFF